MYWPGFYRRIPNPCEAEVILKTMNTKLFIVDENVEDILRYEDTSL
jgi:hypothetical protein